MRRLIARSGQRAAWCVVFACLLTTGWTLAGPRSFPGVAATASALSIPEREIYTVPADGGRPHRVTRNRFEEGNPSWSPDGSRLLFYRARKAGFIGGANDIWSIEPDGTDEHREIRASGRQSVTRPQLSPDGNFLAFVVFAPSSADTEIQVSSTRTSGRAIWASGAFFPDYAWTADSSGLIHADGQSGLVVENRTDYTELSGPAGVITGLDVASDGRIAFVRGGHLWVAAPDGTQAVRLQARGSLFSRIGSVAFSPDRSRIAFDWLRCPARSYDIYTIPSDGSGRPRRITGRGFSGPLFRRPWSVDPAYSPDGKRIAYARSRIFSELDPCVAP